MYGLTKIVHSVNFYGTILIVLLGLARRLLGLLATLHGLAGGLAGGLSLAAVLAAEGLGDSLVNAFGGVHTHVGDALDQGGQRTLDGVLCDAGGVEDTLTEGGRDGNNDVQALAGNAGRGLDQTGNGGNQGSKNTALLAGHLGATIHALSSTGRFAAGHFLQKHVLFFSED